MQWRMWQGGTLAVAIALGGCGLTQDAADLDVAVGPEGRPYDVAASWWAGHQTETRHVSPFQVIDGQLLVMDGNTLATSPDFFADEAQRVSFGSVELVDLSIVWEVVPEEGNQYESPLGVRLDVPGREVATWERFTYAYGTDGGVGGVTSAFAIEADAAKGRDSNAGSNSDGDKTFLDIDYDATTELFDINNDGIDDTLIFSNGFGDGGFPMSRGVDADGALASLMIWHTRYPWRLAVQDGTPPPDITEREDEMIECMERRRLVDIYGFCVPDQIDG